jgi:hypothetical protein
VGSTCDSVTEVAGEVELVAGPVLALSVEVQAMTDKPELRCIMPSVFEGCWLNSFDLDLYLSCDRLSGR